MWNSTTTNSTNTSIRHVKPLPVEIKQLPIELLLTEQRVDLVNGPMHDYNPRDVNDDIVSLLKISFETGIDDISYPVSVVLDHGKYYVINGQHRIVTAKKYYQQQTKWQANIYHVEMLSSADISMIQINPRVEGSHGNSVWENVNILRRKQEADKVDFLPHKDLASVLQTKQKTDKFVTNWRLMVEFPRAREYSPVLTDDEVVKLRKSLQKLMTLPENRGMNVTEINLLLKSFQTMGCSYNVYIY
jgi:hypothetical protein